MRQCEDIDACHDRDHHSVEPGRDHGVRGCNSAAKLHGVSLPAIHYFDVGPTQPLKWRCMQLPCLTIFVSLDDEAQSEPSVFALHVGQTLRHMPDVSIVAADRNHT